MKWGYASTAAIVRSLQKDLFYRQELERDMKLVLLDYLSVSLFLKLEEWLPLLTDLIYYGMLTGLGRRTLGEAYSNIAPVDLEKRNFFLKYKAKRIIWILFSVVIPFTLKKKGHCKPLLKRPLNCLTPLNSILFYFSGAFPSIVNRVLSVRYIFYPQRPPAMDADAWIYKGLAVATAMVTFNNLRENFLDTESKSKGDTGMLKASRREYKCPVCLDAIAGLSFTSVKCGHVYCWHCISRWMTLETGSGSGSCPVCRIECDPPDLLPLANLK